MYAIYIYKEMKQEMKTLRSKAPDRGTSSSLEASTHSMAQVDKLCIAREAYQDVTFCLDSTVGAGCSSTRPATCLSCKGLRQNCSKKSVWLIEQSAKRLSSFQPTGKTWKKHLKDVRN